MTLSPEELDAIETRSNAATPGPWGVVHSRDVFSAVIADGLATIGMDFEVDADAEFIAHAREDIPRLISRIRELEQLKEIDRSLEAVLRARIAVLEARTV